MIITIPGKPIPLKRPRFSIKTGRVYNSQSKEMDQLSFLIAAQWKQPILIGPIQLNITFFMPIPASLSKKKRDLLDGEYNIKHVDLDNLQKFCLDVINYSNVWEDDSQVALINASKVYSTEPRTEIEIISLNNMKEGL